MTWLREKIDRAIRWPGTPYIVLVIFCCILLFPIYWTIVTSFKSTGEIFAWPPTLIPKNLTFSNYVKVLLNSAIPLNILNSTICALAVTAFVVVVGVLTVYGLVMYPYRGSGKVAITFFLTRIVPPQSLWLPFLVMLSNLGLVNTRLGVISFLVVLVYPLSIWMLIGIFKAFPRELLDAAEVDGATRLRALIRVVLPIVAPGVGAVAIISFLWSWNEFMFPLLCLNSPDLYTVTLGIFRFVSDEGIQWGPICASGVLTILPGMVFFIIAQRYIVEGLTAGALKA